MNKELLQQALECFEEIILHNDQHVSTANKGAELLCAAIAQPEQEGDAKDAERYRLIRSEISIEKGIARTKTGVQSALMAWWPGVGPIDSDADDAIDKAIDAAIASQKVKP